MYDNIDDYRFITEDKTFAINLVTGNTVDDPKLLRAIRKVGHHSLEWRGALEKNRVLVDRVLKDIDYKIVYVAATYTFDKDRADDTAQEIRLMVTDIVLKNLHREYEDLLDFTSSCINNFARRVFSTIKREIRKSPHFRALPIEIFPHLQSQAVTPTGTSYPESGADVHYRKNSLVSVPIPPEYTYDPILELQWEQLKDEVRPHLTRIQRRVFDLIVEDPNMTETEMAEVLGYSDQSGVSHILMRIRTKVQSLIDSGELVLN